MKRILLQLILLLLTPLSGSGQALSRDEFQWVNPLPKQSYPLVRHGVYFSESMQTDIGYYVYLPPGYDSAYVGTGYPVVYYLHGWSVGSEANSVYMASLFNQWIVNGSIPPRIYVFLNGGEESLRCRTVPGRNDLYTRTHPSHRHVVQHHSRSARPRFGGLF
jgi:enterochelin esterase-like enzyme